MDIACVGESASRNRKRVSFSNSLQSRTFMGVVHYVHGFHKDHGFETWRAQPWGRHEAEPSSSVSSPDSSGSDISWRKSSVKDASNGFKWIQMASNIYFCKNKCLWLSFAVHKQKTRRKRKTKHKAEESNFELVCVWPVPPPRHAKCWNHSLHTSKTPMLSIPCYTIRMYHICEPQAKWFKWIASTTCNTYDLHLLYPFWLLEGGILGCHSNGYEVKASAPSETYIKRESKRGASRNNKNRKKRNGWKTRKEHSWTFLKLNISRNPSNVSVAPFSLCSLHLRIMEGSAHRFTNSVQLGCS